MEGQALTLFDLNSLIRNVLNGAFPESYWVVAEVSEIRINKSGHCYLELVEKDPASDEIKARARATIWSFTFRILRPYFETSAGRTLEPGLKILVNVTVEFHEQYGLSLNIKDIDPVYTLGDIARKRFEIIARLEAEGIINMNRELDFPLVPQRIAVISSESAAGYGDFVNQLFNNTNGYKFKLKLFQAYMQGTKAEDSITRAMDAIYSNVEKFDVVVIIRGGGSKAELGCFDSYQLSYYITQFPIPVITGIGHERDESIADIVAHTHLKTPTAVAEFLINRVSEFEININDLFERFSSFISESLNDKLQKIISLSERITPLVKSGISEANHGFDISGQVLRNTLQNYFSEKKSVLRNNATGFKYMIAKLIQVNNHSIIEMISQIINTSRGIIVKKQHRLNLSDQALNYINPETILKRGYSITSHKGKIIKTTTSISAGDIISTRLSDGNIESLVNEVF